MSMSHEANFIIVSVSDLNEFPLIPQVINRIKGYTNLMLVCASGTNVEYSFDGEALHGRISTNQIFTFLARNEPRIWFRGTGVVDVHIWRGAWL